jgi:hypothetical protein
VQSCAPWRRRALGCGLGFSAQGLGCRVERCRGSLTEVSVCRVRARGGWVVCVDEGAGKVVHGMSQRVLQATNARVPELLAQAYRDRRQVDADIIRSIQQVCPRIGYPRMSKRGCSPRGTWGLGGGLKVAGLGAAGRFRFLESSSAPYLTPLRPSRTNQRSGPRVSGPGSRVPGLGFA